MITTCYSGSFLLCSFSIAVLPIRDPSQPFIFCLKVRLSFVLGVQVSDLFQVLGLILTISVFKAILLEGVLFQSCHLLKPLFMTLLLFPYPHEFRGEVLFFTIFLPQEDHQNHPPSRPLH